MAPNQSGSEHVPYGLVPHADFVEFIQQDQDRALAVTAEMFLLSREPRPPGYVPGPRLGAENNPGGQHAGETGLRRDLVGRRRRTAQGQVGGNRMFENRIQIEEGQVLTLLTMRGAVTLATWDQLDVLLRLREGKETDLEVELTETGPVV